MTGLTAVMLVGAGSEIAPPLWRDIEQAGEGALRRVPTLAQLDAVLAPLGHVIWGPKMWAAERLVLCTDAHGQVERYGFFALRRLQEEGR
jgi:YD repeat-containing protein